MNHRHDDTPTDALPTPGYGIVFWICVAWLVALALAAAFADLLPLHDPADIHAGIPLSVPTSTNLLGTDQFGRDVLSRILYGARISLLIGGSVIVEQVFVVPGLGFPLGRPHAASPSSHSTWRRRFKPGHRASPSGHRCPGIHGS